MNPSEIKQRNISIDILKFFAAIIITNSHMGALYPHFKTLATGGAIGDALFFFCSGFTLFLGRMGRFDNWYKRRINRIYPTIFAWAIIKAFVFHNDYGMKHTIFNGGGWFVSCIMLYYIILYFIQRYCTNHLHGILNIVIIACGSWFIIANTPNDYNMYGESYFKWFHFFIFMLMGAMMGITQKSYKYQSTWDCVKLIGCIGLFYACYAFKNTPEFNKLQMLTWFPLMGVVLYFYKVCNSELLTRAFNHKVIGWPIKFIGGLCLEIYLVQGIFLTDKMNFLFPLNLFIMFAIIVCAAYLLRCGARIFAQTFKDMDYNWQEVFKTI